jgi:hypothetical protein
MAPEDMATAKRTPKVSRISRDRTVAYARKQKAPAEAGGEADSPDDAPPDPATNEADAGAAAPASVAPPRAGDAEPPVSEAGSAGPAPETAGPGVEPWPDATPPPTTPADPARARTGTVTMPVQASIGAPPAMPADAAPIETPVNTGSAEDPTRMPGPREIPGGNPDDPAAPPGSVPRGDSRSMRRRVHDEEFALIYRIQTYVISRFGVVGTRGQWRVVEYPTSASASHAYAKECSRFVSEGFSDYRA